MNSLAWLRSPARTGINSGVILIFFIVIGLHVTLADLLRSSFGNAFDLTTSLLIYMALIGIWTGWTVKAGKENPSLVDSLTAAAVAGLMASLMHAVLLLILSAFNSASIDMREYITELSPDVVRQTLLDGLLGNVWMAILIYTALFTAACMLGELLDSGWQALAPGARIETLMAYPAIQRIRNHPRFPLVMMGLIGVIVFLLPLGLDQYWNYNLGTVGIYVLLGLGLNIIVGMAGLLVLGYVAFFAIGAYAVALLTAPEPHAILMDFWLTIPIGIMLAAASGLLLGLPVLRTRGDYLAIVTLGFGEIIRIMVRSDVLTAYTGGPRGVRAIAGPEIFGIPFSGDREFMYIILIAVVITIYFTYRLQNSRAGRAWNAMREDEKVAQAMGINTYKYKLLAFAIGAAFAGLGGVLFASRNQFTGPEDHALTVSINVLSLLIVGGMGSIPGVILGSFVLKGLPEILRPLEDYRILAFGALLVIMMILRPEGLWPATSNRLENRPDGNLEPPAPGTVEESRGAS